MADGRARRTGRTGRIRVLVVGPRHPGPRSRGGMATVVGLMRERHDHRVHVVTVATYVDASVPARLATAGWGLARAVVLVLAGRVDVVHVHLAHGGSVLRKSVPLLVARWRGVPAVVHAHSYDFASWYDALPRRAQGVLRRLLPAAEWLVLGEGLVEPYRERLGLAPGVVSALHNPAPPVLDTPATTTAPTPATTPTSTATASSPGRPVHPGHPVRAVALGRMGHRKGTYDLLEALDLLDAPARARLRVVVAGDGEVEQVRAEVDRRGLGDVVEVRSWLAAPQRDALLRDAEVFLLPSHAEGLPMAMLEAMAAGLVPVVTRVGAMPEVARDDVNAVLLPPGDPAALAAAVQHLVLDDDRRARLSLGARRTAGAMGVEAWFETLVSVWSRVSGRPGPPPR